MGRGVESKVWPNSVNAQAGRVQARGGPSVKEVLTGGLFSPSCFMVSAPPKCLTISIYQYYIHDQKGSF